MEPNVAMILEILSDGKWHEIEELKQRMALDEYKVQQIATFLNTYDFVTIDELSKKVKISRDFKKLLVQPTI